MCCPARQYLHHDGRVRLGNYGGLAICSLGVRQHSSGARRERGYHVSRAEPVIVRWISSESVRAPTFFIAVARWVSTVLWLMPRT
jgi:hypothetical protein